MQVSARDILLSISIQYDGDYQKMIEEIKYRKPAFTPERIQEALSKVKSNFCEITGDQYPEVFKHCANPPILFYYYGNLSLLEKKYRITCVGSRKPSIYQNRTCYEFLQRCEEHFKDELVVVSGMADGLDQTFMKAAMERGSPVVSIIGSGIDNPYPSDNQGIYDYCKSGKGLVISEYPGNLQAKKENFLFRNRLLAIASPVLFIGGGTNRSGTSSTLKYALDFGKEVCALPCNVTGDDLTNAAIKSGAESILCPKDLIDAIESVCDAVS